MKPRYVVDTNVLIAASAGDPTNPTDIDATPQDPGLRLRIWEWLSEFDLGDSRLVLDYQYGIFSEYKNKLGYEDYGIQVVQNKIDTQAVDYVKVDYDKHGDGKLPPKLENVVHDRADRKMVAAGLDALQSHGKTCIAFAGDTDWHGSYCSMSMTATPGVFGARLVATPWLSNLG